jgi:hypothetical protein
VTTIRATVDRALEAYDALAAVGETVDEEWQYVSDLAGAWRARLDTVARARAHEAAAPELLGAIEAAAGEIGRISDPHRAIDWLSTFPQVVLLALGEADGQAQPAGGSGQAQPAGGSGRAPLIRNGQ